MSDVPFSQVHTEFLMAKAHGAALEKADAKKKAEAAEEARKRVMAGVDPSRWSLVTRRDGAVRAAVQAAHAAKAAKAHPAAPEEKPRTRWKFVPAPGQVVAVKIDGGTQYAKILDWGPGGVHVATKDGEIDAVWADVRPVPERELVRMAEAHEATIEEAGRRLARYALDELPVGFKVMGVTVYEAQVRGVIVQPVTRNSPQFIVVRQLGSPYPGNFYAFRADQILAIQDEHGELPE